MANRFPLVVDKDDNNKIKELPAGDNLNLSGSGIVNAASIDVNGQLTANSILVNGVNLAVVATTGNYNDLINTPVAFSGNYNDLANKPTIPTSTRTLSDVQNIEPSNGQVLLWNETTLRYEPGNINAVFNIEDYNIGDLNNVITIGDTTNKFLKYYAGAWRPANVTYSEVQNTPTKLSDFTNDLSITLNGSILSFENSSVDLSNIDIKGGSIFTSDETLIVDGSTGSFYGDLKGSVFGDDSSLLIDGVNSKIVGLIDTTDIIAETLFISSVNMNNSNINSSDGIQLLTSGQNGLSLICDSAAPIFIDNTQTLDPQSSISINSGSGLNLKSSNGMLLQSGPLLGFTDLEIKARNVSINSNNQGGLITIGSRADDVSLENSKSFILPRYDNAFARDLNIPQPEVGTMIYNSGTNTFQVYIGGNGGGWTVPGGVSSLSQLTDVRNADNAANGNVLAYDSSIPAWVPSAPSGGGGGLGTRIERSGTTASAIGDNDSINIDILNAYKGYVLYKIETSHAAWVRIYTDDNLRSLDARTIDEDPLNVPGLIAETITVGAEVVRITPGVIGYNDESPVTTTIPIRVTNLSGSSAQITVTVTIIPLES